MMTERNFYFLILMLLLVSCSQKGRFEKIDRFYKIEIGESINEVVLKMESKPDEIIYNDTIYHYQEEITDILTFIYYTPRFASNDISIFFKDCEVLDKHFD